MDLQILKQTLVGLGFTPDKLAPLLLLGGIAVFLVDKKFKPIKRVMFKIEDFIIRLCGALETDGDLSKLKLYETGSPTHLTEEGRKALEKIGFKKDIDDNIEKLFKLIDRFKPKSRFDVEQICVGLIRYVMSDKELTIFNKTEGFLFNNPAYNNSEYFKAAGLYLRDKYLDAKPDIK